MGKDAAVARVMARQRGLITGEQAFEIGLTEEMVRGRLARGRWRPVRRGVFADAAARPSRDQAILAAILAAGPIALASHLTAAELWGLPAPTAERIEQTTVLERQVRLDGVRAHRSGLLVDEDRGVVRGIPTTA